MVVVDIVLALEKSKSVMVVDIVLALDSLAKELNGRSMVGTGQSSTLYLPDDARWSE